MKAAEYKRDVYADNLAAQTFLEPVKGKSLVCLFYDISEGLG